MTETATKTIAGEFATKIAAGEKFTDADILQIPGAANEVCTWLEAYEGNFEFVLSVREKLNEYGNLTVGQIRGIANCMLADAKRAAVKTSKVDPTVPVPDAGFYAIPDDTMKLHFYKIDRPTDGRWAGRVFAGEVVGGQDRPFPVKGAAATKLFKAIADFGADEAMKLYGKEIGKCGVCNRTLTDEISRAYGIGPTCRAAKGW